MHLCTESEGKISSFSFMKGFSFFKLSFCIKVYGKQVLLVLETLYPHHVNNMLYFILKQKARNEIFSIFRLDCSFNIESN